MGVYQISRIQVRSGKSGNLPEELAKGEFGLTTDTSEIFIGSPDDPKVSGRYSYPFKNIKLLTEFDVQKQINGDVYYHGALSSKDVAPGTNVPAIPLFEQGKADFGIYDFTLTSNDTGTFKLVGKLKVIVDSNNISNSIVKVISADTVTFSNWTASLPMDSNFSLINIDPTSNDDGRTWLRFNNNFSFTDKIRTLKLTVSGINWADPV